MVNWQGLNYNIAEGQKLDRIRMAVVVSVLLILCGLFIHLALNRLAANREKFEQERNRLNVFQERIDTLSDQIKTYKKQIDRQKKQWGSRVKFANLLIQDKSYSFIKTLNLLESLMPAGIYIEEIALKNGPTKPITFTLKADTYDILLKTYGKISQKFDLTIMKEFESAGLFTARLRVEEK